MEQEWDREDDDYYYYDDLYEYHDWWEVDDWFTTQDFDDASDEEFDGVANEEVDRKARGYARRIIAVRRKLCNTRRLGFADQKNSTSRTCHLNVKPRIGRSKSSKLRGGRFKPGNQALFGHEKSFAE